MSENNHQQEQEKKNQNQQEEGLIRSTMWGRGGVIFSFFVIVLMALFIMFIDKCGLKKKDGSDDIRNRNEQVAPAPEEIEEK